MQPTFFIRQPKGDLSRFVQDVYYVNLPCSGLGMQKYIPSMHPYLFFLLEGDFLLKNKENTVYFEDVLLQAPCLHAVDYEVLEETSYVGFSFKPAAVNLLFDTDMRMYANNTLPPKDIIEKHNLTAFCQELKRLRDVNQLLDTLESFIRSIVKSKNLSPTLIEECITMIHNADGCITSKQLQSKFNMSNKYLEKLFLKSVGITPAKYCKSFRFFSVIKTMVQESPDIVDVIARYEYFDNSHFRRDFKKYTGEKPEEFFNQDYVLVNQMLKILTPPNR